MAVAIEVGDRRAGAVSWELGSLLHRRLCRGCGLPQQPQGGLDKHFAGSWLQRCVCHLITTSNVRGAGWEIVSTLFDNSTTNVVLNGDPCLIARPN